MDRDVFAKKPPPELVATFDAVAPEAHPGVVRRLMFGFPAYFVNGNMFMALFQDRMALRLADDDRSAALEIEGSAVFEPMPGRAMKEYVELPREVIGDPGALEGWVARSFEHASSLPPKAPKRRR